VGPHQQLARVDQRNIHLPGSNPSMDPGCIGASFEMGERPGRFGRRIAQAAVGHKKSVRSRAQEDRCLLHGIANRRARLGVELDSLVPADRAGRDARVWETIDSWQCCWIHGR